MRPAYTVRTLTVQLWAAGSVMANYLLYAQFAFITFVYPVWLSMDPKQLGWALALGRLVAIPVGLVAATLSDLSHAQFGRRRPYMLIAAAVGAIMVAALWWGNPAWGKTAQFAYLAIVATALYVCWDIFSTLNDALGYELSDDYGGRATVQATRSFWFAMIMVPGGYMFEAARALPGAIAKLTPLSSAALGGDLGGFRLLAFGIAGLILAGALVAVFSTRERFQQVNRLYPRRRQAPWAGLTLRGLGLLVLAGLLRTLGSSMYGTMAGFIGIYYVCGGDKMLFLNSQLLHLPWLSDYLPWLGPLVHGFLAFALALLLMLTAAPLVRWLGKRRGILLGAGGAFVCALIVPLFMRPGHPELLGIYALLLMPVTVLLQLCIASLMPDLCDLGELAWGRRFEALFQSVYAAFNKIAITAVILVSIKLIAFIGFDATLAVQPAAVMDKMRLIAFTTLAVGSGLAFLVAWFIPETRELLDQGREELDARHLAAGGRMAPTASPLQSDEAPPQSDQAPPDQAPRQ